MNQNVMGSVLAKEKGLTFSKMCEKNSSLKDILSKLAISRKETKIKKVIVK